MPSFVTCPITKTGTPVRLAYHNELARHFLHLADRAGGGRYLVGMDGLNGIHDQSRGIEGSRLP